eukprot:CAMPEP_0185783886 /NCGR_PEP_ID=MMETSP1174-20130828/119649_1 /TAXON_ID=35687 /ORGANISM="Dictyocha speculum, Strain CCMP1381" /LENGTH=160 /DNA_ID=CAMNT_0028475169 /DNA_START=30 /DNA_END=508 /DNA_ORIENTATION=-
MRVPVVSYGVLIWMQDVVTSPTFLDGDHAVRMGTLLLLAQCAIDEHPMQRPTVFEFLKCAATLKPTTDRMKATEWQTDTIHCMVHLMISGFVPPVLQFLVDSADLLDQSMVRIFVLQIARVAAPPFSAQFAAGMGKVLKVSSVLKALGVSVLLKRNSGAG